MAESVTPEPTFTPRYSRSAKPEAKPEPKTPRALRKEYDALAAQCTAAFKAGDKPNYDRLMAEKKTAFLAWRAAAGIK